MPACPTPLRNACLLLLLAISLAGCSESIAVIEGRERREFDTQVETEWRKNWAWVDGVQFLEKGGIYADSGEPGERAYDKLDVLPLLKRLSGKHQLKWFAIVDKKKRNIAVAIVGQYPATDTVRDDAMTTLLVEQRTFPLDILVQTGERWLSLDFLSEEDSKFLSDGDEDK
ncbi:MAG TPA: hypothetical protein VM510_11035 [Caulifigura sp.]|nr:hypothetical protein [Caulifigura sp.]